MDATAPQRQVNTIRAFAAHALGSLGDKRAIPALTQTLEDEDEGVQKAAASALRQVG